MQKKLVSIIMPTFKRTDLLERAIQSVGNQTYSKIELIIIDDNGLGTEFQLKTKKIVNKYLKKLRIKYIVNEVNQGACVSRNDGIVAAKGYYITFLDDDNYLYTQKIEKQVNYLEQHRQYNAVYCGWNIGTKKIIPKKEGNLLLEQLIGNYLIDTGSIMIKKSTVIGFGGFDSRPRRHDEVGFLVRFFNQGNKIGVLKESLYYYSLDDRSNHSNAEAHEQDVKSFLVLYSKFISPQYKKIIYVSRYRSILLRYLKEKKIIGAIRVYLKMCFHYPILFNKSLIIAFFRKINGRDIYEY